MNDSILSKAQSLRRPVSIACLSASDIQSQLFLFIGCAAVRQKPYMTIMTAVSNRAVAALGIMVLRWPFVVFGHHIVAKE